MPEIETTIRLIVIGQDILIAAIFLFGSGARVARVSGALLMLGIASYLYMSDPVLRGTVQVLEPMIILLGVGVPFSLWLFARAVFEAPWPRLGFIYGCAVAVTGAWLVFVLDDAIGARVLNMTYLAIRVVSLVVVAHALWLTLTGRSDDLIERRRLFRLVFVAIASVQIAAVLVVELVLGNVTPPAWLTLLNVIIIAVVTLALAIPMLRLNSEFFAPEEGQRDGASDDAPNSAGVVQSVYQDKLLNLMADGYYRETGLTIPMLAAKLDYPEHQLRRLINGHLGYRNFSAFLNSYRIDEAKAKLSDPEGARLPVLTIALDLGYASLGPFNRAFKLLTGMTPTEFRRRSLGATSPDSE